MLREIRRRFRQTRGEPLATLVVRVLAVSPYPEEPEDDENYQPSLIVQLEPGPASPEPGPGALTISTLLFVEWARDRLADPALALRLRALLPRLRVATELGRVGPQHYERHRRDQREHWHNQREAARYTVELHRDEDGVYIVVGKQAQRGRWTETATLLVAATVAPYEALLQLEPAGQEALLAWQEQAVERWLNHQPAGFPVATWDPAHPLAGAGP